MKLYKTSIISGNTTVSWQGSMAEAAAARAKATAEGAKRKDVETVAVDVPTDKAGLLAWLNQSK